MVKNTGKKKIKKSHAFSGINKFEPEKFFFNTKRKISNFYDNLKKEREKEKKNEEKRIAI